MKKNTATLIGLVSILLWSANVGLIRTVTHSLGAIAGAAILYSIAFIILLFTFGFPKLSTFPQTYLIISSVLFCVFEISFALSLGFATSGRQTLELGLVNYLWPSMTILFAIIFNGQKANLLVIPGLIMAIVGVASVLGDGESFSIASMAANVASNPLSYALALTAALTWSVYCTITTRMADGKNGVTFYFLLCATALWIKYLASNSEPIALSLPALGYAVLAALVLGFAYATWNIGILGGNVALLAVLSYFIPILSSVLTSIVVQTPLSSTFWQGCILTSVGSLLCWLSTREKKTGKAMESVPDKE